MRLPIFLAAACLSGISCGSTPPHGAETSQSSSPPRDAGASGNATASVPVVTLPGTTQALPESGLCMSWSPRVVDLSSLGSAESAWVHGIDGGFSVVTLGDPGNPQVTALALDATGTALRSALSLPIEGTTVSDAIGTSEGGWLVGWDSGGQPDDRGTFAFVLHGSDGSVSAQTASQPGNSGTFGPQAGGATGVVSFTSPGTTWMGSVSSFPLAFTQGTSMGVDPEYDPSWRRGAVLTLELFDRNDLPGHAGAHLRTWDASATPSLDVALPDALASAMQQPCAAIGDDPSTAIVAQPTGVSFVSSQQILVVPSDILLNGASPWASPTVAGAQRAVVGFDGHAAGDGGGGDALEIVEVSSTGARSVVGEAELPPDPDRHLEYANVRLVATLAEDAYLVTLVPTTYLGPGPLYGVVFSCLERAS